MVVVPINGGTVERGVIDRQAVLLLVDMGAHFPQFLSDGLGAVSLLHAAGGNVIEFHFALGIAPQNRQGGYGIGGVAAVDFNAVKVMAALHNDAFFAAVQHFHMTAHFVDPVHIVALAHEVVDVHIWQLDAALFFHDRGGHHRIAGGAPVAGGALGEGMVGLVAGDDELLVVVVLQIDAGGFHPVHGQVGIGPLTQSGVINNGGRIL